MDDLQGKVVVITGASRGIGARTARLFAARGARVALLARSGDAISALADELGDTAMAQPCDVADFADVERAIDATTRHFAAPQVVIGNAGVIAPIGHLDTTDPDEWGRAVDINLKGIYHLARATLPAMKAAGGGTILNLSSGAAHGPVEGWSAYCASKAGAAMLTRALHLENADAGLRVMGLSPGTVATQMQRDIKASGINRVSKLDWSDHISPDWVARALLWMCSPDSDRFLGQEISLRDEATRARIGLVA